jgi:hypothetical protein
VNKRVFRTNDVAQLFPEQLKNIRKYINFSPEKLSDIYEYWHNNDISYEEFEQHFNTI